ncbi:MAG: hypothetical protein IT461_03895 [Planctomycetes bacterium]|nr:hypothetical protein [Planctomycetota bacterium]
MKIIAALLLGVVFALGLGLSGMTRPEVVLGFLDFAGAWNPALMFVMCSAIPVFLISWKLRPGPRPLLGGAWPDVVRHDLDRQVLLGSALFGIGWGLAGVCPGPAITILGRPTAGAAIFVACMLAGMFAYRLLDARRAMQDPA